GARRDPGSRAFAHDRRWLARGRRHRARVHQALRLTSGRSGELRGELLSQHTPQQLARLREGQLRADCDALGRPSRTKDRTNMVAELVLRGRCSWRENDGCNDAFAPLDIGYADDCGRFDCRMVDEHLLDLTWRQVLATAHDHIVEPALD